MEPPKQNHGDALTGPETHPTDAPDNHSTLTQNAREETSTGLSTPSALDTLVSRLREGSLSTTRIVNLRAGSKKPVGDHAQFRPGEVTGNYGVHPGRGLVLFDIDRRQNLEPVEALPESFTVSTPHGGEHRYYAVEGDAGALLRETVGVSNPSPTWGDTRIDAGYVVGPDSTLSPKECTKDDCDSCGAPDGGLYTIHRDLPIATVAAEEVLEVVRADPAYADRQPHPSRDAQPEPSTEGPGEKYEPLPWEWDVETAMSDLPGDHTFWERLNVMRFGSTVSPHLRRLMSGEVWEAGYVTDKGELDRSRAEVALGGHLGYWFHRDREIARYVLDNVASVSKWWESPHHREDVLRAVEESEEVYQEGSKEVSASAIYCVALTLKIRGEATATDLVEDPLNPVGETQTKEARAELEEAGVIEWEKRGRSIVYRDVGLKEWLEDNSHL